ncbi:MAG: hypothetical protein KAH22_08885 [Thiotrichaceae bacterium]|nr:hypothetical protein [Thiotrichaceae bacterium]
MSNSKHLRWLNKEKLATKVAQRFVSFCEDDIDKRSTLDGFNITLYTDAMKLVISKLEQTDKDAT